MNLIKVIKGISCNNLLTYSGFILACGNFIRLLYALYWHEMCGPEFMNRFWFLAVLDTYLIYYFIMRCMNKMVGMGGANVYPDSKNSFKVFMDLMMIVIIVAMNVTWRIYMPSTCP
jgi:hypothetical protein